MTKLQFFIGFIYVFISFIYVFICVIYVYIYIYMLYMFLYMLYMFFLYVFYMFYVGLSVCLSVCPPLSPRPPVVRRPFNGNLMYSSRHAAWAHVAVDSAVAVHCKRTSWGKYIVLSFYTEHDFTGKQDSSGGIGKHRVVQRVHDYVHV